MAKLLDGKVAAITGAVTGIGRAIALEFIRHGACVAINYYPDEKSTAEFDSLVKQADSDTSLIGVAGDVSKPEVGQDLVARTVETFGKLDVSLKHHTGAARS